MPLQNQLENNNSKVKTDPGQPSVTAQLIAGHGLPEVDITWTPSKTEEYKLRIKILSDDQTGLAQSRAVKYLASRYKKDELPDSIYATLLNDATMAELVSLAYYEPELETVADATGRMVERPRKLVWITSNVLRQELSADRIAQLCGHYYTILEQDSPSAHLLSKVKDMTAFCDELMKDAEGSATLFLASFQSLQLAELLIGTVRYLMTATPLTPSANTMTVDLPSSDGDILSSIKPVSESSLPALLTNEEAEAMAKEVGFIGIYSSKKE